MTQSSINQLIGSITSAVTAKNEADDKVEIASTDVKASRPPQTQHSKEKGQEAMNQLKQQLEFAHQRDQQFQNLMNLIKNQRRVGKDNQISKLKEMVKGIEGGKK